MHILVIAIHLDLPRRIKMTSNTHDGFFLNNTGLEQNVNHAKYCHQYVLWWIWIEPGG